MSRLLARAGFRRAASQAPTGRSTIAGSYSLSNRRPINNVAFYRKTERLDY
jgi:hypothetical protein